jgi:streptogramin lyase
VSDGYGKARVHKFSPDGALLLSWGGPGAAHGQFRLPHSIRVDGDDRVWVADRENSRLQIFDENGEFLVD